MGFAARKLGITIAERLLQLLDRLRYIGEKDINHVSQDFVTVLRVSAKVVELNQASRQTLGCAWLTASKQV
jgi:hypothetical protein